MRRVLFAVAFLVAASAAQGQTAECSCGKTPPGRPSRVAEPYAGEPADLRPFTKFAKPYYEHYTKTPEYNGAAADAVTVSPQDVEEVAIGFLGPVQDHKDIALGQAMLHGAELAIEEANARGGYGGKPFRLKIHNDGATWGSSSNEIVKMVYEDKVWAMLGSISGDSTHIGLRVSLRSELPMVNSAATDPTIPETIIPWMLNGIQDDRVQGYTLARRIYSDLGLKRVALLRVNERYGRFGVMKFRDASRRLGHPVIIEQKYIPGATDFTRELRVINDSRVEAIVLWGDAPAAAEILKQMRALGMTQRVFGSARVVGQDLLGLAGAAAEGLEVVYPYDPNRDDPAWLNFQKRFTKAYGAPVDSFSALAFDTMNILLNSVCQAGLNRGKIRDALYSVEHYKGVTGEMIFDPNAKNVTPMYLGTVKAAKITYRRYTMEKPYASLNEGRSGYEGPTLPDAEAGIPLIGVFGPGADKVAASVQRPGLRVTGVASEESWGKSSTALVNLIYQPGMIGLIATDRASAHLAGQIAAKTMVPLIALSTDRTLTGANVPWIFRLGDGAVTADAVRYFAEAAKLQGPNRERIREYFASGVLPYE
jgi:branched-chain amino acid transport system substrate-binding protein